MAKCRFDWAEIAAYRLAGHTLAECAERFGFSMDAWYKAIGRGLIAATPQNRGGRLRYDWAAIQLYYNAGHTYRECKKRFGFASVSWSDAVRRGDIVTRPREWPVDRVLSESKSRFTVKRRLLKAGILKNECEECGLSEWRGGPLSIQVDHRNGDPADHRLENLRMLCPNCHSQTETYGGRNRKPKPFSALIADISQLNYSRVV